MGERKFSPPYLEVESLLDMQNFKLINFEAVEVYFKNYFYETQR